MSSSQQLLLGEGAGGSIPVYIEDVFSTYLYTGTGSTQTITNGIDLSTKGGLVWIKSRSSGSEYHVLQDTVRGRGNVLSSNTSDQSFSSSAGESITTYNSTGFSLGTNRSATQAVNTNAATYVSWTFREQPKFFDIVTYTGTSVARTIAHNLGSVPGCIIIKCIDGPASTQPWAVYHRSTGNTQALFLNLTQVPDVATNYWNDTTPTSTVFSLGASASVNNNTSTYVAYLFAHNAGGFGLTGTDNVISCGSYTGNGSTQQDITLGYEPQWLMIKRTDTADQWIMVDNMRGFFQTADNALCANNANAEAATVSVSGAMQPIATGFHLYNGNSSVNATGGTYIYIAIRRGPMKVPTTGTSVFQPVTYSGNGSNNRLVDTTITPDLIIDMRRENIMPRYVLDRLRGYNQLYSNLTNDESANAAQFPANTFNVSQTGVTVSADEVNASGRSLVIEAFRRAPSVLDVVCYTGNQTARTISHNLAAAPELMITKNRSSAGFTAWLTCVPSIGMNNILSLNTSGGIDTGWSSPFTSTPPTSSVFSLSSGQQRNQTGVTYVAYLFATCAGVSKVGSYTGTGATQTIDCGFGAGGARFVLIKRTDSTGDWYVWDTARGMVAGTDPSLLLNSTAAEVNANSIYTIATGFQIVSTAAGINATGGTYIFLAIA